MDKSYYKILKGTNFKTNQLKVRMYNSNGKIIWRKFKDKKNSKKSKQKNKKNNRKTKRILNLSINK